MPYIPERKFEDNPDIYSPYVPLDPDNIVEVCTKDKEKHSDITKTSMKPIYKYTLWLLLSYVLFKLYLKNKKVLL